MLDERIMHMPQPPAGLSQSQAQVVVLVKEEDALVESSYRLESLPPAEERAAGKDQNILVALRQALGSLFRLGQEKRPTSKKERAVFAQDTRTKGADIWLFFGCRHQPGEGIRHQPGIGIEKKDEGRLRGCGPLVAGGTEAPVLSVDDNRGASFSGERHRLVATRIVDDDHGRVDRNGTQCVWQDVRAVEGDDHQSDL